MEKIHLPVQPGLTVYLDDYEEQDPIEGHDRAKWFLDPNFKTPAPKELEAAGQVLYSQRVPNRYTIHFFANGGNGRKMIQEAATRAACPQFAIVAPRRRRCAFCAQYGKVTHGISSWEDAG